MVQRNRLGARPRDEDEIEWKLAGTAIQIHRFRAPQQKVRLKSKSFPGEKFGTQQMAQAASHGHQGSNTINIIGVVRQRAARSRRLLGLLAMGPRRSGQQPVIRWPTHGGNR
jgi:hypothetical protein